MSNPLISPVAMFDTMQAPNGAVTPASSPTQNMDASAKVSVIDGTPVRVVSLVFAAAGGLVLLKMAGFRFNVGVSN